MATVALWGLNRSLASNILLDGWLGLSVRIECALCNQSTMASVPESFRKPDREWMSLRSIWWLPPFSPPLRV